MEIYTVISNGHYVDQDVEQIGVFKTLEAAKEAAQKYYTDEHEDDGILDFGSGSEYWQAELPNDDLAYFEIFKGILS
jgi:hypothetical protein